MQISEINQKSGTNQNKSKFVLDILDYALKKKIDEPTKNKLLKLISNEVGKSDALDKNIVERLEKLEGRLGPNSSLGIFLKVFDEVEKSNTIKKLTLDANNKTKKHSPKTMVKFLYRFTIDEKFKWFTHNPEGLKTDFDYKREVETAVKEYKNATGWNINNRTYHNVKNFIINTGEKSKTDLYGKGKIGFSWRDLEKWCEEHPNIHPYNAELKGNLFKKYINQFKQIIQFRTDETDLTFNIRVRKLIRDLLGVDFDPLFTDSFSEVGQSVSIFCDINLLFNAIKQIIEWIVLNKAKSNEVEINLENLEGYYLLEIFHKNSYMSISPKDEKMKGLSGDFDKTRKMLFSVADWEIISQVKSIGLVENYKIWCLDESTELIDNILTPNRIEKINEKVNGVKHLLKLYKTQDI